MKITEVYYAYTSKCGESFAAAITEGPSQKIENFRTNFAEKMNEIQSKINASGVSKDKVNNVIISEEEVVLA